MSALSLKAIRKTFGPTVALDGVDLQLRPGQVHALIGENGAGKSTLMNVIAGALKPDQGIMEIDGRAYSPSSGLDGEYARPSISMMPWSGLSAPAITFINVLLPAPFSPMSACTWPGRSWRSTPSSATVGPNVLRIAFSESALINR